MNRGESLKSSKIHHEDNHVPKFDCGLLRLNCIKPLPKSVAKLALYIVCISDLSSIIKASYDLASSITVSTAFVIFSIICSSFGLLGFYSITSNNKTTMKIYTIYTYVRLLFETISSFGISISLYIFQREDMYENLPIWLVFSINGICLILSRIAFSYVAYSFYVNMEILNQNIPDKKLSVV